MVEDKRLLLFFAISLAIVIGWQALVGPPAPPPEPAPPVAVSPSEIEGEDGVGEFDEAASAEDRPTLAADPGAMVDGEPPAPLEPIVAEREESVVVETEAYRVELTNRGGQIVSYQLLNEVDSTGEAMELVRRRSEGPYPFAALGSNLEPVALESELFEVGRTSDERGERVELIHRSDSGEATKVFDFDEDGLAHVSIEISGVEGWGVLLGPGVLNPDPEKTGSGNNLHSVVYREAGSVETVKSAKADEVTRVDGLELSWIGLQDNYFLTAVLADDPWREAVLQPVVVRHDAESEDATDELIAFTDEASLSADDEDQPRDLRVVVRPGAERFDAEVFFGAKHYTELEAMGRGLQETIQWGWFGILARPLLIGLEWIHANVVANYGWAIVLMTCMLKIVLFPLTHKGHESMLKMQKLQPRMQAIRQRWKGKLRDKKGKMNLDAQRQMNDEIQELFRQEGASPYGGCLPILLQIPVFFAFFRLLLTAVELRNEPWVGWIEDLSAPDPIYLLPILMGASQVLQQRLTPMTGDPMQRRIMQMFPWIFMFVAFSFPSGLVLYWTTNNVLTIGQTMLFNRRRERKGADGTGGSRSSKKGKKGTT